MEERADKHFKKLQQRRVREAVGELKSSADARRTDRESLWLRVRKNKWYAMKNWKKLMAQQKSDQVNVVKRRALV